MAPIRTIFEQFADCCQKAYTLYEYTVIDETLFAFRGRCEFRVYIPSKSAKYGIKVQALVDATAFFTVNLDVYAGKQPTDPYSVSNNACEVVERLNHPK